MTTATPTAPASTTPPILTPEQSLVGIAQRFNLLPEVQTLIVQTLAPFVSEAGAIAREAESVKVTDATQVTEIKKSRELRLKLAKVRTACDKAGKGLKEDYLRPGQYIDAARRHILGLIEPVETRLEEQEKFAERMEFERKQNLKRHREDLLRPYTNDTSAYLLTEMTPDAFADLLAGQKAAHEARMAKAKQDEDDRIAAANERAAEAQRMREENARLRREADDRDAAAKIERDRIAKENADRDAAAQREREAAEAKARAEKAEADRKLADERAAREKLERAEADRKAAVEKATKARAAAERKAARAPDKAKLGFFADSLEAIPLPTIADVNLTPTLRAFAERRDALVAWMRDQIESI